MSCLQKRNEYSKYHWFKKQNDSHKVKSRVEIEVTKSQSILLRNIFGGNILWKKKKER